MFAIRIIRIAFIFHLISYTTDPIFRDIFFVFLAIIDCIWLKNSEPYLPVKNLSVCIDANVLDGSWKAVVASKDYPTTRKIAMKSERKETNNI